MKNLTIVFIALLMGAASLCADAQTKTEIPAYRQKGYSGSVSFTNQYLVWLGFDTSHGYMFNEHHYLGGGAGFFLVPIDDVPPTFFHTFAEYRSYWCKRRNTPTAGIKAGFCFPLVEKSGNLFRHAFEIEPNLGWDWGTKNGKGLSLTAGASMFVANRNVVAMPKLSFGINF